MFVLLVDVKERQSYIYEGGKLICSLKLNEAQNHFEKVKDQDLHYQAMLILSVYLKESHTIKKESKTVLSKQLSSLIRAAAPYCHLVPYAVEDILSVFDTSASPPALEMQKNATCQLIAFCLLIKGAIQLQTGNSLKAAMSFRKSWQFYQECHRIICIHKINILNSPVKIKSPLNQGYVDDVLFGVGLFYFWVSLIPEQFSNFADILGFKGECQKGKKLLETISNRSRFSSFSGMIASILLQNIYQWYMEDSLGALQILDKSLDRFPDNLLSLFVGACSLQKTGKVKQSETYFQTIYDNSGEFKILQNLCLYRLGLSALQYGNWGKAIMFLEKCLSGTITKSSGYQCQAFYLLGVSQCFTSNYSEALVNFQKCISSEQKGAPMDSYISRKSGEFLRNSPEEPMCPFEKIFFEANVRFFETGRFKEAVKVLSALNNTKLAPDQKALFFWSFAQNLRQLGKLDRSQKYLENALKEQVKTETYVHPFSQVELAEIHIAKNNLEEAKNCLTQAKNSNTNYDYKSILLLKIDRLSEGLNEVKENVE